MVYLDVTSWPGQYRAYSIQCKIQQRNRGDNRRTWLGCSLAGTWYARRLSGAGGWATVDCVDCVWTVCGLRVWICIRRPPTDHTQAKTLARPLAVSCFVLGVSAPCPFPFPRLAVTANFLLTRPPTLPTLLCRSLPFSLLLLAAPFCAFLFLLLPFFFCFCFFRYPYCQHSFFLSFSSSPPVPLPSHSLQRSKHSWEDEGVEE